MKYTEKNATTAEIKFHGYIGTWWINAKDFDDTIDDIAKRYANLEIRVHCYGGEVFEGLAIHNTLKRSKLKVVFHVDGVAASMMPVVMFSGDEVYMAENAFQMFHAPYGYAGGNSKDFFSTGKLLRNMEEIFINGVMKKSNLNKAEAEKYMDGTDYWLTAKECLGMGLIKAITDGVDPVILDKPEAGTPVEKIFGQYAAIAAPINNLPQQNNNDMTKEQRQTLITQHGLTNVTADSSDTAVLDAVNAKITALFNENNSLKQQQAGGVTAQADAVIAAKEVELKTTFTAEQKSKYLGVATAMGVPAMKSILDDIKPVASIVDMMTNNNSNTNNSTTTTVVAADRKDWTLDQWAEKDPDGLEAMSKAPAGSDQEKAFNKLYNAAHNTQYPV
jgi:ATP-dependent protease ClpP protease subunit